MPDSAVRTFADPYPYQRAIRNTEAEVVVTSSGKYRAELTRVDLCRLWMQRSEEALPSITHSKLAGKRSTIFFLTDPQQAPMVHTGMELPADYIMFCALDAELHRRSASECHWGAMSLPPQDLTVAGRAVAGYDVTAPAVTSRIRPAPHLLARLRTLHAAAGQLAATVPDVLARPEVARAMERELVGAMVRCLTVGEIVSDKAPGHRRIPVMRRFEQILNEGREKPLYVTEISAAIGVSVRTLRQHCLEHLGMSPHRYLWLRRMNLARRALSLADPAITTVTFIAAEQGFWELGRFAVAYRRLFGESPSATLRKPYDTPPATVMNDVSKARLPILP
jgi:AraC-like DNA-binding protein